MSKRNWLETLFAPRHLLLDDPERAGSPVDQIAESLRNADFGDEVDTAEPEPESEPAAEAEPTDAPTDPEPAPPVDDGPLSFRDFAAEQGLTGFADDADDTAIAAQVIDQAKQFETLQQERAALQQERDLFQRLLQQQNTAPAAQPGSFQTPPHGSAAPANGAPATDEPAEEWNPYAEDGGWSHWANQPDWEDYAQYIHEDKETGKLLVDPTGPADAMVQLRKQREWEQQAQREFFRDPAKFLGNYVQPQHEIERRIDEKFDEMWRAREQQLQTQMVVSEMDQLLFEHDDSGQFVTDPATGQPKLQPHAERLQQTIGQLEASGMRDPNMILAVAKQLNGIGAAAPAAAPGQPDPQPTETPAQPQSLGDRQLAFRKEQATRTKSHRPRRVRKNVKTPDSRPERIDVKETLEERFAGINVD